MDKKTEISIDITGLKCPIPLIKTRRAVINASKGQLIEFLGTNKEEVSRKEILLAIESLNQELITNTYYNDKKNWRIVIKKV